MATQIAPTPILYGQDSLNVIEDLKRISTERSKENAKKLVECFEESTVDNKVFIVREDKWQDFLNIKRNEYTFKILMDRAEEFRRNMKCDSNHD